MKKTKFLPLLTLGVWMALSLSASGQYFNYASAHTGLVTTDYHSLIRTIDDTSALVYFYDSTAHKGAIARIGLTLSCRKAYLPRGYSLNDMRITGNNVYFCGSDGANPIIGHIKLTDFAMPTRKVTLYSVDRDYVSNLNRLVAYEDGGKQKVVLVGDVQFTNHPTFPCPYLTSYYDPDLGDSVYFYIHYCLRTIIIEADFQNETHLSDNYVTTGDTGHHEIITEVIETPNHLAFVGYYTNHRTTIIHRCSKSAVINSFTSAGHYCYSGVYEGKTKYHGCIVNNDTIAVSSLSTYYDDFGTEQFSTNIRGFDLTTMDNTFALRVPLNTKTEPYDLMYMEKDHQLVLLQDINLPSLSYDQNTFVHINPYATTPYSTKCWFEAYWVKPFSSLSRLNDTTYVSSGGEYWCMKDTDPVNSNSCNKTDSIKVTPIIRERQYPENYSPYDQRSNVIIDPGIPYSDADNEAMNSSCITY